MKLAVFSCSMLFHPLLHPSQHLVLKGTLKKCLEIVLVMRELSKLCVHKFNKVNTSYSWNLGGVCLTQPVHIPGGLAFSSILVPTLLLTYYPHPEEIGRAKRARKLLTWYEGSSIGEEKRKKQQAKQRQPPTTSQGQTDALTVAELGHLGNQLCIPPSSSGSGFIAEHDVTGQGGEQLQNTDPSSKDVWISRHL